MREESGSALVAALCLIFIAGMLVTATVAMSQYNTFTVTAHTALQKSFYINEGVAGRVQYLIAADRTVYPNTSAGEINYDEYNGERYIADGVTHQLDYYGTPVEFAVTDTRSGWDFSSGAFPRSLQSYVAAFNTDTAIVEEVDSLTGLLTDYNDTDSDLAANGREAGQYDADGQAPLPRNSAMQFREELFYIPGFTARFPADQHGLLSGVRLIVPDNLVRFSGNPSIFSANRELLMAYCNLEEQQADDVVEALKVYHKERTLLSDQLDPLLLEQTRRLSWQESGNYTVTIGAPADSRRPSRKLTFSFAAFPVSGPNNSTLQYLEWIYY